MKMNKIVSLLLALALLAASTGCGMLSRPPTQREQTAGIGALAGGLGGAIIGSFAGSAVTGGLFGMPLGALAGYYIGDQWLRDRDTREARSQELDKELARLREENERLQRQARASSRPAEAIGSGTLASTPKPKESAGMKTTQVSVSNLPPDNVMVGFDFDKSSLNDSAHQTLSPIITWLKGDSGRNVTVAGYTDSIGSEAYNVKLSQRRAQVVKDFMVQSGVSAERIITRGMGKANPVAPNDTQAGREKNRRVEVISNGAARTASAK
ncbi:MAG: OmpA family protein [Candidatus Binatia bacterium]